MPQFTVNTHRHDPYKVFKFRVMWDGRYVAGISRVSALTRVTQVVEFRDGDDPSADRRSPGLTTYEPIALSRGVTHDVEFERWANLAWNLEAGAGNEVSLKDFRKDLLIELLNEAGQIVVRYKVFRAWVSEYQALPELNAQASEVAIESITLQHEGWVRDPDVKEPVEP